jgi:uncharacterized protein (DUF1330 family)
MATYLVVEMEISNWAGLEPYRAGVEDTITKYGGRFIVRAGATKLIEGAPEPKTVVIVEFPDAAAFDRWWASPQYQEILPSRLENSTGRFFTVEGVSAS